MSRHTSLPTCLRVPEPGPLGTVEPLVLPATAPAAVGSADHSCHQPLAADLALIHGSIRGEAPRLLIPPHDEQQHIRYRWWIGHHAAFGLWQALTRTLHLLLADPEPSAESVTDAARMLDCYSVLFLYAGSCSPERYDAVLRHEMRAYDPAFSGTWARDHRPLPGLLRQARSKHPRVLVGPLMRANKVNKLVHVAIAKKLVPDGESLLKEAGAGCPGGDVEHLHDRYDTFFEVRREHVCHQTATAQIVRRLAQVACDLAATGVPPVEVLLGGDHVLPPGSPWTPAARRVAEDAMALLGRFAGLLTRSGSTTKGRQ